MLRQLPIFVYGTLMIGERNYIEELHNNITHFEAASVKGKLYYYKAEDFPALMLGNEEIKGQLFYLNQLEEVLKPLDEIEGFIASDHPDNMYDRRVIEVRTANGGVKEAYAYLINPLHFRKKIQEFTPITENSWKLFNKQKRVIHIDPFKSYIKSS